MKFSIWTSPALASKTSGTVHLRGSLLQLLGHRIMGIGTVWWFACLLICLFLNNKSGASPIPSLTAMRNQPALNSGSTISMEF